MEKSTGRKTRQLEVVWHEVAGDNSHPTADQIYQRVRRHIPNISLGTVYHNLQKLVAEGKLQVLTLGRTQHFDPLLDSHQHFIWSQGLRGRTKLSCRSFRIVIPKSTAF